MRVDKGSGSQILMFLKMKGDATSALIAEELNVSKEGARKHLIKLAADNLIESFVKSEGVGRPTTYYRLTEVGLKRFPDTHAEVTVDLLRSVRKLLGDNALDLLISDREKSTYDRYAKKMIGVDDVEKRLDILVRMRSEEGYMAQWEEKSDAYYLTENHCPICAAATECQGFCRSELENFKQLIGLDYTVERVQHIVSGGQRCVYRIKK
ncbi:transcriptional regulator [Sphingobacterium sp. UT-1RO-CII-1]|uniref:helix-turn-helix transcriptional regulator n=1 Tax=Sphingobacterium sp. UT-1RO-CII-1 TaxID=2995225 RepID=UPI00227CAEAD|nr:metalloregulator ArsR/SmtB family transcription factor [Sphingobacterium sp. UT-1RO-CII-1]MCY4781250.1 transcriptional regulator [Sphingobacterium sp. UT-1RO-CII-1]